MVLNWHWRITVNTILKIYNGGKEMIVLGINKILNWCQITSGGRTYTCTTKLIDGKLFFYFKKEWHSVAEFVSEHAEELVSEGGQVFSRTFKK